MYSQGVNKKKRGRMGYWIQLAQYVNQCWALVNKVMSSGFIKGREFLH
jgi:hypothetical protein